MLKQRGVQNVKVLLGGWADWVNGGNPVEK
jgi:3-mercaptopyruvate sulfurtransferase SseA